MVILAYFIHCHVRGSAVSLDRETTADETWCMVVWLVSHYLVEVTVLAGLAKIFGGVSPISPLRQAAAKHVYTKCTYTVTATLTGPRIEGDTK